MRNVVYRQHGRPWPCGRGFDSLRSSQATGWQSRHALPRRGRQRRCNSGLRHQREPRQKAGNRSPKPAVWVRVPWLPSASLRGAAATCGPVTAATRVRLPPGAIGHRPGAHHARVAQWTERPASNRQCPGSIPGAGDGAGAREGEGADQSRARGARAARRSHEPEVAGPTPAVPTTHRARGAAATHRSDKPGTAGSTPAAPIRGCPRGLAERPPGCEPGGPGSSPGAGASRARGSIGQSGCLRSNRMGVRILPRPPFQFVARHRFFDSCPIKDK